MDLTTEAIRLGIHMARMRAEVASTNVANADVDGYRARRLDFGQAVGLLHQAAMDPTTSAERLAAAHGASVHVDESEVGSASGTTVSLDSEVAELETAGLDFQSLTTVMSRRFALMQLALAGRN
ncbi:hypothetical protein DVT68_00190 [Dyella solisilvae]|uniref:Flagellar basal body rod protein FlgB n=1 Tax=Dyella solisilvae TaxID=1920168 RepID=A0A370K9K7_9GAMM|nr:hypothetical protein [Dyella solisilvae]RDI99321.1 hypothetical protein DVT68_00190 [Dyella solisilvae]